MKISTVCISLLMHNELRQLKSLQQYEPFMEMGIRVEHSALPINLHALSLLFLLLFLFLVDVGRYLLSLPCLVFLITCNAKNCTNFRNINYSKHSSKANSYIGYRGVNVHKLIDTQVTAVTCSSCGGSGHSTARSRERKNRRSGENQTRQFTGC